VSKSLIPEELLHDCDDSLRSDDLSIYHRSWKGINGFLGALKQGVLILMLEVPRMIYGFSDQIK